MGSSKPDVEHGEQQQQQQQPQWQQQQWQQQPQQYPPPHYYGTFQGNQQEPVTGWPQPVPPSQGPHYVHDHNSRADQSARESGPLLGGYREHDREGPLPFCGLGFGWFLFIFGFICVIPWYIGTVIFFCLAYDHREHTGLLACTIAALVCFLAGGSKAGQMW